MTDLEIDFYSDIICPWCLIGQHRLGQVLHKQFQGLSVDIERHPVLLLPDCPSQGIKIADLMRKRGIDPVSVLRRPEAEARAVGLSLDLTRQPLVYPTIGSHTLIRLARRLGTQHKLAVAISTAYFTEAINVADTDVLSDIAADHGFDKVEAKRLVQSSAELEETRRAAASSAAQGIHGVPHFVLNGGVSISGHQSENAFAEAIRRAMS